MNVMHRPNVLSIPRGSLVAAPLALALLSCASSAPADHWKWTVSPYAWATDVGVNVELDGRQVVDQTIPVNDLLDDIDLTFQGRVEAKRGAHCLALDVFYVAMSDTVRGLALPQNAGEADLDWTMDMTIADLVGVYDPRGDDQGLSFLYGARVIDQRATVEAEFTTPSGSVAERYRTSETLVDALAGLRFDHDLTSHLSYRLQVDVSTGSTELTWSIYPSLHWKLGDGSAACTAGYRRMSVDFKDEDGLATEMTLSGPVLGFRMSF
jgi:hypothetical protein